MKRFVTLLLSAAVATSISCAHVSGDTAGKDCAQHFGEEELQGVLWVQNAVEYRAITVGTYAAARRMLDTALVDQSWSAMPETTPVSNAGRRPAVILDLDETSLDNSAYEAQLLASRTTHTEEKFNAFIRSGEVAAIPGALDFLNYAHSKGVRIFYITNQDVKIEDATRATLARLGYPVDSDEDVVLTVNDRPEWAASDKAPRRDYVASRYRVLLLLGDDFNDFVTAKSTEQREQLFATYASYFGTKWFMIPNPMYGSWDRALLNGSPAATIEERFASKMRLLRTRARR